MADQENRVRVTRLAAKKRTATESSQEHNKKKRVVLGEIQNVVSSQGVGLEKKMKCDVAKKNKEVKPKRDAKNSKSGVKDTLDVKEDYDSGIDVVAGCDDPQMCAVYVSDIYGYLHNMEMEVKRRPLADYLEKIQKDVKANMRGILIDWKYEEISPPHVEDFCNITDNEYTKENVVMMEADVLKFLKFEMGNPNVKTFLRRFTRIAQEDYKDSSLQVEFLSYYLAELICWIMNNLALQCHSRYKAMDLKECVMENPHFTVSGYERETPARSPRNIDRSSPLYFERVLKNHHISKVSHSMKFAKMSGLISQNRVVLEYIPKQRLSFAAVWVRFVKENGLVFGRTYSFEFNPKKNAIQVDEIKK